MAYRMKSSSQIWAIVLFVVAFCTILLLTVMPRGFFVVHGAAMPL